jgi:hypothetical protein
VIGVSHRVFEFVQDAETNQEIIRDGSSQFGLARNVARTNDDAAKTSIPGITHQGFTDPLGLSVPSRQTFGATGEWKIFADCLAFWSSKIVVGIENGCAGNEYHLFGLSLRAHAQQLNG